MTYVRTLPSQHSPEGVDSLLTRAIQSQHVRKRAGDYRSPFRRIPSLDPSPLLCTTFATGIKYHQQRCPLTQCSRIIPIVLLVWLLRSSRHRPHRWHWRESQNLHRLSNSSSFVGDRLWTYWQIGASWTILPNHDDGSIFLEFTWGVNKQFLSIYKNDTIKMSRFFIFLGASLYWLAVDDISSGSACQHSCFPCRLW